MLADYAWLVRGLLALHEATGEPRWLASAVELAEEQERHLADERGGFFVAEARPDLLLRSKEIFDGAVPAANAVAALNALDLAAATGDARWRDVARRTLAAAAPLVEQFPDGGRTMAVAAARWHAAATAPTDEDAARRASVRERSAAGVAAAGSIANLTAEAVNAVDCALELDAADGDGWHPFRLTLRFAGDWHANAHGVGDEALVPTTLAAGGAELRAVTYPPGEPWAAEAVPVYRGSVEITGELRPTGAAGPTLRVTYQVCDDERCLPPVTRRLQAAP